MESWKKNKWAILIYLILGLAGFKSITGWGMRPEAPLDPAPLQVAFGQWKSKKIPISYYEKEMYGVGSLSKKMYYHGSDFIWHLNLESIRGHHTQHQPEICYTGAGWSIIKKWPAVYNNRGKKVDARVMIIKKKDEKRLVAYWFANGKLTTGNYYQRVFQHIWDDFMDNPYATWTFQRVSLPIFTDLGSAEKVIESFITEMEFKTGEGLA